MRLIYKGRGVFIMHRLNKGTSYSFMISAFVLLIISDIFYSHIVFADELPSIQKRVDVYNQEKMKHKDAPKMSEADMALMKKAADDLEKSFPNPGLPLNSLAPDFELKNAYGKKVSLSSYLKKGPVVLVFYRGAWCPYCNIHLHALLESEATFNKYGAALIAVTPQTPDKSLGQVKKDKYPFEILSDLNYTVAKAYNLYFEVTPELHAFYKSKFGLDIEAFNGKGRLGLPVPGTFVINQAGKIVALHAKLDYKTRMEPSEIVKALKTINKK